ncbi:DUF4233 domain-containing protein [Corynebacterium frankenforstense]|uniref:DUF4233 domain-containing protein n=1 Tax=Corynebacterium frankenforstense TaxID=1230998 RepID=UPI00254B0167|nr:DUF4233 domain-containing protein [Corynebacterium frankenforstense]MDK6259354.1 DUF4233 domain-containing protein [Corynebacterium frankenforstense]
MSDRPANETAGVEYGPLGPGHAPEKDPLKGLRGVMAGTLVMEAISFALVLTVILRVDGGAYWTTVNWVSVTVLSLAFLVLAFLQRYSWATTAVVVLQVVALAGFLIHPSMGIVALLFIAVWAYILYLRSNLIERMRRGLLTTQHM